jgi:two-component system nitrate/nitrite response regulator NarL
MMLQEVFAPLTTAGDNGAALAREPVSPSPSERVARLGQSTATRGGVVRIVIADEHPIFRDGLRRLLETEPRFHIVGETGDGVELARLVRELAPDILLFGLSSTRQSRIETLQEIAASACGVRTIILTGSIHTSDVADAVQLGAAAGVLSKDSAADVLFKGIASVTEGSFWVGDHAVANVADSLRKFNVARRRAKAFGLTARELEIVQAVVNGSTNKQIAQQFAISESTVKRHVTHIFDKLGASNRVEVALFAAHHRLLDSI